MARLCFLPAAVVLLSLAIAETLHSEQSSSTSSRSALRPTVNISSTSEASDFPCTIPRVRISSVRGMADFRRRFVQRAPVILVNDEPQQDNAPFRALTTIANLVAQFGDKRVKLADSSAHCSVLNARDDRTTLADYIREHMRPLTLEHSAKATPYLFGDYDRAEWADLIDHYKPPKFAGGAL